jgi:hypothetical protein
MLPRQAPILVCRLLYPSWTDKAINICHILEGLVKKCACGKEKHEAASDGARRVADLADAFVSHNMRVLAGRNQTSPG